MRKSEELPEDHLIQRAADGDKRAFGILYERYLDEIYRFAFYKVSIESIAEDITEETFLRIWEKLPSIYRSEGKIDNFRAYVYRMANNLVIDYYRRRKPVEMDLTLSISKNPSPEAVLDFKNTSQHLAEAIKGLEPEFQQIILLRFVNQLSHKEIAKIMGISDANSRVMQFRALKRLKEILSTEES